MWKVWNPHFFGNCCLVSPDVVLGRQVFEQSAQNVSEHLQSFLLIYPWKGQCCADVKAAAYSCISETFAVGSDTGSGLRSRPRVACLYQVSMLKNNIVNIWTTSLFMSHHFLSQTVGRPLVSYRMSEQDQMEADIVHTLPITFVSSHTSWNNYILQCVR